MFHEIAKHMSYADVVTLIGTAMGIFSVFLALSGEFLFSAVLIVLAVFMDGLDGRIARFTKRKGEFGVQLDSLSDLIVFGVAVAVFGYAAGLQSFYAAIILTIFVLCGALRLARFNITKQKTQGRYFEGTPIPLNAVIPFIYLLFLHYGITIYYLLIIYGLLAITMISNIRIKKL